MKNIDELFAEFREANGSLKSARAHSQAASSEETTCLNRLNSAQTALDEWFAKLKNGAPWNSDWHQEQRTRNPG